MHGTFSGTYSSDASVVLSSSFEEPVPQVPVWQWRQAPLGTGRILLMALLALTACALFAPFFLLAVHLVSDPSARAFVSEHPAVAVQLALGFVALVGLLVVPLTLLARRALGRREILIDGTFVHARKAGIFGFRAWQEPLGAYTGTMRRVRSSLSGASHELVLVHPNPDRSAVVFSGPHILEAEADFVARFAGIAEIPSRDAVSVRLRDRTGLPDALPAPAAQAA
jgi:hypothetical protein